MSAHVCDNDQIGGTPPAPSLLIQLHTFQEIKVILPV